MLPTLDVNSKLLNLNADYDLTLFESLLSRDSLTAPFKTATQAYLDLRNYAYGFKRNIRLCGGFWDGSFNLSTNPPEPFLPVEPEILLELFYTKLGTHLQERESEGNPTWEGYVHELYLSTANSQRVRTYDSLTNSLIVVDGNCNILNILENEESILRYGMVQRIIDVSKLSNLGTNINDYLAAVLSRDSWARPQFVSRIASTTDITVQVRVRGYLHTAAFKYHINNYTDVPSNVIVTDVINNSDYLALGRIEDNNLLITNDYCENGLKILLDLCKLGSLDNPIWHLWAINDRRVDFEALDPTIPQYYIGLDGRWSDKQGGDIAVSPRRILPAVIEDTFFPVAINEPDSIFPKSNIFLASQVGVRPDGTPEWSSEDIYEELEHVHVVSEAKQAFNMKSFDPNKNLEYGLNGFNNSFIGG